MADEADFAFELQQKSLDLSLAERRAQPTLPAIGMCYYCDEPVQGKALFCNAECSHDWEVERAALKRSGKLEHAHHSG